MDAYKSIRIGVHVNVPRSDGRIQSARISDLHLIPNVSVEWREGGEIMGKEVDLKDLFLLNPILNGRVFIGDQVLIKRSDERIHHTIVTEVHTGPSVSVEWKEGEEILGKYVDLDLIQQLNPHLF